MQSKPWVKVLKRQLHSAIFSQVTVISASKRQHVTPKHDLIGYRAVFTWVSKVIRVCFGFALLHSVIGLKLSRHFLNQSEVKPRLIATCSRTFSRALLRLHVFASSFDWFTGLSVSFVIGQSDYFGFGFTTLIWKLL